MYVIKTVRMLCKKDFFQRLFFEITLLLCFSFQRINFVKATKGLSSFTREYSAKSNYSYSMTAVRKVSVLHFEFALCVLMLLLYGG